MSWAVVTCLAFTVLGSSASPTRASDARSWNGYQWGRTGDLSIQLVNNTSAKWTPYLQSSATAWSAASNIDYRVVSGPTEDPSACSPVYGVIEVCSANYGKNGWLGMTNVYTSNGFIVMATVRFNDYYPTTSTTYAGDAWYSNTTCHELGHALGLNHEDSVKNNANSGSCLDMTNDPSGKKSGYGPLPDLKPGWMDFAALAKIYGVPMGSQLTSTMAPNNTSDVPEPRLWLLLVAGFGLVGIKKRRTQGPLFA